MMAKAARLARTLLLIAVPPFLLLHFLIQDSLSNARDRAQERTVAVARLASCAAHERFAGLVRYMESHVREPGLRDAVQVRDSERVREELRRISSPQGMIDRMFVTDRSGTEWSDYPHDPTVIGRDFSHRDWYQGVRSSQASYISHIYQRMAAPREYVVAIATPIPGDGGILVAQTTVPSLESELRDAVGSWGGSLSLVDREGRSSGPIPAGGGFISARADIPIMGGSIVAQQDAGREFAEVHRMAQAMYLLGSVLALILGLAGHMFFEARRRRLETLSMTKVQLQRSRDELEQRVRDRTAELAQANDRLRQEIDRRLGLAAIIDSAHDAVVGCDLEGNILSWNPAAEQLYGFSPVEEFGRPVSSLAMPLRKNEMEVAFLQAQKGEPVLPFDSEHRRKNGMAVDVSVTVSPIRDSIGQVTGVSVVARDITVHKRVDRMKDEFISVVSHELRTPLTSIYGSLRLIQGSSAGKVSEDVAVLIDMACRNSERLSRLVGDILDISRIESGQITLTLVPVDLMAIAEQAIAANQGYFEQHGVRCSIGSRIEGFRVLVDPDRLMQVLANLLSNAAKFSPSGEAVQVDVALRDGYARVSVTDHGPGIPELFRARVFHKFAQADSSDVRSRGGTGLGLSIAKSLIEKLGGRIGFDSTPGFATTFYVELPEWKRPVKSSRRPTPATAESPQT